MKSYVFLFYVVILFSLFSCNNDKKRTGNEYNINNPASAEKPNVSADAKGLPTIDFNETEYNFGVVIKGEKVSHSFVFKNNGTGNLVISNVNASCGCTAAKWTKEPVKPGESGFIDVVFDSTGRMGKQVKSVTVSSNTQPNSTELLVRCDIVE